MRASGADLGIAWDGDADRCFFIDDTGAFVDGDFLTALLAEALLATARQRGPAILYDVRASRAVPDAVIAAGGVPHVNRVGHAFFKTRMREEGSLFGGEVSGPLLLPRLLLRRLGDAPGAADPRAALPARAADVGAARALSRRVLHLRRDQLAGRRPAGQDRRDRGALSATRQITHLDGVSVDYPSGTSTCARRTPSRCCGCASSRSSRRRTWRAARRGAATDPLVNESSGGQRRPGSTGSPCRRRSRSVASTRT